MRVSSSAGYHEEKIIFLTKGRPVIAASPIYTEFFLIWGWNGSSPGENGCGFIILGSGAAACMAAIRADEAGIKVLMVTKGALGMGNTPLAPGGFEAAIGHADARDNPEIHFEDTLKAGMGLSHQKVVWAIAKEMVRIPFDLEQWGCPLPKKGDKFIQRSTQLLTYPRLLEIGDKTGRTLIDTFRNQILKRKIPCLANVMATNLLRRDSRVIGALALDLKNLKLLVINAKVTLLDPLLAVWCNPTIH